MTEQWQELKETIIELRDSNGTLTQQEVCKFLANYMKVLEKQMQEPCEDCISREEVQDLISRWLSDYLLDETREALETINYKIGDMPSVTPKGVTVTDFADKCKECGKIQNELAEDAVSRTLVHEAITASIAESENPYEMWQRIEALPPVTPKYTDEEIDKAQTVKQAYVDKMVELAVKEIKERYSDAIGKMKKAIDEMTEIHSDGEFYIKNVDAKWIISKYLCGAEMSGGGEDEVSD